jgi:vitamin B12 transporter
MTRLLFRLALWLASAAALPAQQRDSTLLPRVVVTATRANTALAAGVASVTVLDGDALRRAGVRDVTDALRLVPGVSIVRGGGPGALTSLFMRGGESDYVRVLVDGVPMNDPGGAIDLAHLTLDNVDRIEVVRGPASVLYGTDAVTGIVQIFTRDAVVRRWADATLRAGRYGERVVDASAGGGPARVNGSLSATHHDTDGILPFNNSYRSDAASGRLAVAPWEGTGVTLTLRQANDAFHYWDNANVPDRNAYRTDRRTSFAADAEQRLGSVLRFAASVSTLEARGRTNDAPDAPSDTLGFYTSRSVASMRRRVADTRLHVSPSSSALLTLGSEWSVESQRSTDSSNFDVASNHFSADRSIRAVYAQALAERGRLAMSLGARYDDNRTFGSFRTGRAAIAWRSWPGGTLRASLGTAFKAPGFFETFTTAFSIGNPALTPERSRSREIGWSQDAVGGRLSLSATWFDQRFRDLIQFAFVDPNEPNYFNVAVASSRGLELAMSAHPTRGLRADASVTLLRTRVDDAGLQSGAGATFVQGERLLRRPPLSGVITVAARRWIRTSIDASLIYAGRRDDRDFSSFPAKPVELPSYTRLNLGAGYVLAGAARGPTVTLQARIENLLGTEYQEIFSFRAPGRSLSVGVRVGTRS